MRTLIRLTVLSAATLCVSSAAQAQQLQDPYANPVVIEPAQPINPYANPAPPAPVYPPNVYAPPPAYPSPYQYQYNPCCSCCQTPHYYYPMPPVYYAPTTTYILKKPGPQERIRRFSLGVHATAMGVSQKIGDRDMILGGAGIQFRIRSKGRFGLELKQDFLYASFWNGDFQRSSYPFTFALMLYVFPNQDWRHFNIYGLAGFGAMSDTIKLRDENRNLVSQDFFEGIGQLGLGLELKFKWFALAADARILGFARSSSTAPGSYYGSIDGAPVPEKSWAWQANVLANFWF